MIMTGGGTKDKKIRIYSLLSLKCIKEYDTNTQICGICDIGKYIITSTGYLGNSINIYNREF